MSVPTTESIQGVGGTVQYPHHFLKRAFKTVQDNGGVCISDEVLYFLKSLYFGFLVFEGRDGGEGGGFVTCLT